MSDRYKYGVTASQENGDTISVLIEKIERYGFAVADSGLSKTNIIQLQAVFDRATSDYRKEFTPKFDITAIGEENTLRAFLLFGPEYSILFERSVINSLVTALFGESVILNQVNGIINPPKGDVYSQGRWHRDLPYQHFVCSRHLALSALFCVDDFSKSSGGTEIIIGSHKNEKFPSSHIINEFTYQIEAKAGSIIFMDAMAYHRGGENKTNSARRAVNFLFTIPIIRQPIVLSNLLKGVITDPFLKKILSDKHIEAKSIDEWLRRRSG